MAFCTNCGAKNDGGKFCCNCGAPLPEVQPATQPVTQPAEAPATVAAPVEVQPAPAPAPAAAPVQSAYEPVQPVQPVYQQPVYTQPVNVPPAQSVEKKNGMSTAGFVLGIIGIFTFGLTSLFGLIFSIVGLIVSKKKDGVGKGKAIAGIIMGALMIIVLVLALVFGLSNSMSEYIDKANGTHPSRTTKTTTEVTEDDDVPDYEKMISKNNWVSVSDGSYMVFNRKDKTFKYYMSKDDTTDNYYSGTFKVYAGDEALTYITEDISELGVTRDEIRQLIKGDNDYNDDNLIAIECNYEELIKDGEQQDRDPWTIHYFGFYLQPEQDGKTYDVLDICNMEAASYVTFIKEDQYADFAGSSDPTTTTTTATETSEETSATSSVATVDIGDGEIVGSSVTGTVVLTGTWYDWTEASGGEYMLERYQKFNADTGAIIQLAVYKDDYFDEAPRIMAEAIRDNLKEEGCTGIECKETTIGGQSAYVVSGRYSDGTNLSMWYFLDSNKKLHVLSVEYPDSDTVSYDMFVGTYNYG